MKSADTPCDKIGPKQARNAALAYSALGAPSPAQRTSTVVSAAYSLTMASLAGMVIRRGQVTVVAGTEQDFRRITRFRLLFVVTTAVALGTLVNITVPATYRFGVVVALELILLCLIAAILPSRRFHRSRGLVPLPRKWKKRRGVRQIWVLNYLIHDAPATADDLEVAMGSLVPDVGIGCAAIVFTTTDVQVQAMQRLGFGRDSENSGRICEGGSGHGRFPGFFSKPRAQDSE